MGEPPILDLIEHIADWIVTGRAAPAEGHGSSAGPDHGSRNPSGSTSPVKTEKEVQPPGVPGSRSGRGPENCSGVVVVRERLTAMTCRCHSSLVGCACAL
jgi:hypothetical protein